MNEQDIEQLIGQEARKRQVSPELVKDYFVRQAGFYDPASDMNLVKGITDPDEIIKLRVKHAVATAAQHEQQENATLSQQWVQAKMNNDKDGALVGIEKRIATFPDDRQRRIKNLNYTALLNFISRSEGGLEGMEPPTL